MLGRIPAGFSDRTDAGRRLADRLVRYRASDALVVALPRGGVVVAAEIAASLRLPLEVLIVRKIGHPMSPEFAIGAMVEGGPPELNPERSWGGGVSTASLDEVIAEERHEISRRQLAYRGGRPFPDIRDRTVILVDDGVATGSTVRTALRFLRSKHPQRIVLAVGVAPPETVAQLTTGVEEMVCLLSPDDFQSVGQFYRSFDQVSDDEVVHALRRFSPSRGPSPARPAEAHV